MGHQWDTAQEEALLELRNAGYSASQMAAEMSVRFETKISRSAILGKLWRMGECGPKRQPASGRSAIRAAEYKRERRWAKKPYLKRRYEDRLERVQAGLPADRRKADAILRAERENTREILKKRGASKHSAAYRKTLPRLPFMTKGELRAMLNEAVRNTL